MDAAIFAGCRSVQRGVLLYARRSRNGLSGVRAVAGMDLDLDGADAVCNVVVFLLSHVTLAAGDSAACGGTGTADDYARDCRAAVASRAV